MKSNAVIFDVDGTLANIDHRLHYIQDGARDWDSFFSQAIADTPNMPVVDLLNMLRVNEQLHGSPKIIVVTGRPADYADLTRLWLAKHNITYEELHTRASKDYRNDAIIKREILHELQERYNILFTVDDRQRVVDMWRDEGLMCMQVGPDFDKPSTPDLLPHATASDTPILTVMVGPSGGGKSTWVHENVAFKDFVISSDLIRQELDCFNDMSMNNHVFSAVHSIAKTRLEHSLPTVVDATHLRRKDRLATVNLAPKGTYVHYVVVNRSMEDKYRDGGWRNELDFDLIAKHQQTFASQRKDILAGDNLDHVTVADLTGGH